MLKLLQDQLNRNEFITDLFNLFDNFGNQNGKGLTMVINGKYGSGKSTLLDFIEEKGEEEQKYNIIRYNSWENNIFANPLIPILHTISKLKTVGSKIKDSAKNVLKKIPQILFSTLANAHSIDLQPTLSCENIFDEYDAYNKALIEFRKTLTDYCANKKTILLVDELDRCLPEYQIKVLENLYHILDISNLIVVIALDKLQLECAIKSKFGEQQNICGYLSKFIQYEIDLPEGETYEYIKQLMTFSVQREYEDETKNLISRMFKACNIPLRECQILLKEINIICNECYGGENVVERPYWYPMLISFLTLLKRLTPHIFKKYFLEKRDYNTSYSREPLPLNKTTYSKFLKDVENTLITKLLQVVLTNGYGQYFMLHFINTFYPIRKVVIESLSDYTNIEIVDIQNAIYGSRDKITLYPDMINNIIDKLKILR